MALNTSFESPLTKEQREKKKLAASTEKRLTLAIQRMLWTVLKEPQRPLRVFGMHASAYLLVPP